MSDAQDCGDSQPPLSNDIERLRIGLRRAELRLEGLHRQLDLRLAEIQKLRRDSSEGCAQIIAERDQARADIATLLGSKTFRYSQAPRRLYGHALVIMRSRRRTSSGA